jgi:hypothetical protein
MNEDQLNQARDIIRQDPSLIWYTKDYDHLDIRSVVEAVLNFGTKEQFEKLTKILSVDTTASVFHELDSMPRSNLHPLYLNYYSLYFAKYAPRYSHA